MDSRSPDSPDASPRIAVIGGGISGLATAHRIRELIPRAEVSIFEASDRLGGVLETVERDGFLIERSADNFLATPSAAVDLCRKLGMEKELVPTNEAHRRAHVVRRGRLVAIPEGFYLMSPRKLGPILRSPLLSIAGKLRLLAEPFIPRGPAAWTPSPSGRGQGEGADESVASFATRRLGREVFERLVQPLVAGIYTADPTKLSMAATMPQFLRIERTYSSLLGATLRHADSSPKVDDETNTATGARYSLFLGPTRGMQSVVNALADRLPPESIHLNSPVTHLSKNIERWALDVNPQSFDALVLAVPTYAAAKLLSNVEPDLAAAMAAIEYAGCAVVSLGFHRSQIKHPLDGFGLVVPAIERRRLIAASFANLKFAGRAPVDDVLVRVFIGGAMQPELLNLSDEELSRIARDELGELLQITGIPLITDIARWPRSMPQYHVGHLDRIARIEKLAGRYPTLALAGNAYHGVGIPQCIASGQSAAEQVSRALSEHSAT